MLVAGRLAVTMIDPHVALIVVGAICISRSRTLPVVKGSNVLAWFPATVKDIRLGTKHDIIGPYIIKMIMNLYRVQASKPFSAALEDK